MAEKVCRCGGSGFEWVIGLDGEAEKDACLQPDCPFWIEFERKQKEKRGEV